MREANSPRPAQILDSSRPPDAGFQNRGRVNGVSAAYSGCESMGRFAMAEETTVTLLKQILVVLKRILSQLESQAAGR